MTWFRSAAAELTRNKAFAGALLLLAIGYLVYNFMHPRGFSTPILVQNFNEATALAFVAMAQTVPVLMGGLDLSVGAVMTMCACIASYLLNGSPLQILFGILVTLAAGTAFGLVNGLIVVLGRIQPIIATLATGAIAIGIALLLRPLPGGNVDSDFGWAISNSVAEAAATYGWFDDGKAPWLWPIGWIPLPAIFLFGVAFAVWLPFRRTVTGRTIYAIGSAESAAYMSGLPIDRAKIAAFTLGGFFAACGGVFLAARTGTGIADVTQAGVYTLNSIAAVVLGGTSLLGGIGGAIASIVGALILRVISFYFRILSIEPLLQPLVEGIVLLLAVSLGALQVVRVKNRLELFR